MRFAFEASARDVPYMVARAVNVNKRLRPPPWLVAARRVPPGPSLMNRPRDWDNIGATAEWEKSEEVTREAKYEKRKQARQAANPDTTAAGWTTAYEAAFKVRPRSVFRKKVLKAKQIAYMKHVPVISYPEDALRRQFYENHPFELTRPTTMVEEDALNKKDWSRLDVGVDAPLTGEDVIKHQYYLMQAKKVPMVEAYNRVVSEFYKARAREEVALRVAEEQAIHHGAITNPTGYNTLDKALENEEEKIQTSYAHMENISQARKMRKVASDRSFTAEDMATAAEQKHRPV